MRRMRIDRENGQTLATVAIALVALLAFLALAVDVGQVYAERRLMQNAADAGALEGARQICFENASLGAAEAAAQATAESALVNMGRTYNADPEAVGTSVTVTTTEVVDTFIAGIVGVNTVDVRAVATAVCGATERSAGGLWPVTLHIDRFNDIGCGELFIVWDDKNKDYEDWQCDVCECDFDVPGEGIATKKIAPGDRGWLRLFKPPEPLPDACSNGKQCSTGTGNSGQGLICWIENSHPGPISIGDCIGSHPGTIAATQDSVDSRIGDIVTIPLWDRACYDGTDPNDPSVLGGCPGDPYHVAGFGCFEVVDYDAKFSPPELPGVPKNTCPKNKKVIIGRKVCDCDSHLGGTGGDPFGNGTRSISLVR